MKNFRFPHRLLAGLAAGLVFFLTAPAARASEHEIRFDSENLGESITQEEREILEKYLNSDERTGGLSDEARTRNRNASFAKQGELESKYRIAVFFPDSAADGSALPKMLELMDAALRDISAGLVRQISADCKSRTGNPLYFEFVSLASSSAEAGAPGHYTPSTSRIRLCLLPTGSGVSGSGLMDKVQSTVTHEVGHAFAELCAGQLGAENLKSNWIKMNRGIAYTGRVSQNAYDPLMFASDYGCCTFTEDFAETFTAVFSEYGKGSAFTSRIRGNPSSPLRQKVNRLGELIQLTVPDPDSGLSGLSRALGLWNVDQKDNIGWEGHYRPGDVTSSGHLVEKDILDVDGDGFLDLSVTAYADGPEPNRSWEIAERGAGPRHIIWLTEYGFWQVSDSLGSVFISP